MSLKRETNWYEKNIEEPLRGLVRYLHSKGIETYGSCAHKAYITVDNKHNISEVAEYVLDYMKSCEGIRPEFTINRKIICLSGALSESYVSIELVAYILQFSDGNEYFENSEYKRIKKENKSEVSFNKFYPET